MTAAETGGKLFRDSFKGYNRQDVHDFIEKLNRDHSEREGALKINCDRLLRQKNELDRELSELKASFEALSEENKALAEKAAAVEQQADEADRAIRLEGEAALLREELDKRDQELDELRKARQSAVLTASDANGIQPALVIRMEDGDGTGKFDEAFKMIGSFLQLANGTAKTTVAEAKEKADEIVRKAYEEKEAYISERQERLSELNRQYAELCQRSGAILKQLIRTHDSVDGQIRDSGALFDGESNAQL